MDSFGNHGAPVRASHAASARMKGQAAPLRGAGSSTPREKRAGYVTQIVPPAPGDSIAQVGQHRGKIARGVHDPQHLDRRRGGVIDQHL